ncbi:MAG: transposase [Bdellovibrionia bacterium]
MTVDVNRHSKELREQVLKEVKETGNMALVGRNRGISYTTIVSWVNSERNAPKRASKRALKNLESRLKDAELENRILKELLKKTNQLWLTDEPSAQNS